MIEVLLLSLAACSGFVIYSQWTKIKELTLRSEKLNTLEAVHQNVLLEKVKLEERCEQLTEISARHDSLLNKELELEKKIVFLSASLEQEKRNLLEKIKLLNDAEEKLSNTFKAISSDALSRNNQAFLDLAKSTFEKFHEKTKSELSINVKSMSELVNPIKSALENVDGKIQELEKNRVGAYEALRQQVGDLIITQNSLRNETNHLVSALKAPTVRGRWGEMQLRRVVELAGMLEHCDFREQASSEDDSGNKIRPDMVISMPRNQHVVVDAKAPLFAYLQALETHDEKIKKALLKEHAKQIRSHVSILASKKYWAQFQPGPEFVVLFLPGEIFFSVATENDPSLMEFAMQERIVIATPTILLALLHTVALGWRQENLSENARAIIKMGQELYKRLADMTQHMANLGKNINSAVQSYNATIASMETRVLVSAKKFRDLEVHEKNIIELSSIEDNVKQMKNNL
ncbi:MAG: DNA recombination protein RmuC [Holosporaceae bacterium]|jgi:DNA recombination protein RmuC|nr:DNA recombination protein RmuC [Holosporaceae bacterium]